MIVCFIKDILDKFFLLSSNSSLLSINNSTSFFHKTRLQFYIFATSPLRYHRSAPPHHCIIRPLEKNITPLYSHNTFFPSTCNSISTKYHSTDNIPIIISSYHIKSPTQSTLLTHLPSRPQGCTSLPLSERLSAYHCGCYT